MYVRSNIEAGLAVFFDTMRGCYHRQNDPALQAKLRAKNLLDKKNMRKHRV